MILTVWETFKFETAQTPFRAAAELVSAAVEGAPAHGILPPTGDVNMRAAHGSTSWLVAEKVH